MKLSAGTIDQLGKMADDQTFISEFIDVLVDDAVDEIDIPTFQTFWTGLEVLSSVNPEAAKAKDSLYLDLTDGHTVLADDMEDESFNFKASDGSWAVFFGQRRTPVCVSASSRSEAITKARKAKRRGGNNVVSARQMNQSEKKTAAAGRWVKSRPPGFSKNMRGSGPKPGKRK